MVSYRLIKTRIIKTLFTVVLVIAAVLCLCACGGGNESNDNIEKQMLNTPQNLRIQTTNDIADGIWFVWDEVLLSDYYTVNVNGKQYKVTDACINVKDVGVVANDYAVKVMANCSNRNYVKSDWSQECNATLHGYSLNMLSDGSGYEVADGKNVKGNLIVLPSHNDKPVVKIGNSAFKDNTALTSIMLPESIEEIGSRAFENNTALTEITLPERLKKLGSFAFKGCSDLTSVHIPREVKSVSNSMFRECANLKELTVDSENTVYRSAGNCIIKRSTNQVVAGCAGSVIPTDVDAIHQDAFNYIYGLNSITIPSNINEIDSGTFYCCKDLEDVVISFGVESIYASAFNHCNLKRITVEDGNPIYRSENNCLIQSSTLVLGCERSVIPPDITVIGESAFYAVDLEYLIIPSGVVRIEKQAFASSALDDIVIPSTVESIGDYAFSRSHVKTVIIENGVKSIGKYAFGECPNMERIYVPTSVTSIGELAFTPFSDPAARGKVVSGTYSELGGGGSVVVAQFSSAPTVFSENVNVDNGVDIKATSAYYHSDNSELNVENNYPYVVSYQIKKQIKYSILGPQDDNPNLVPIFDAIGEYKAFAPHRLGYTFGGWAIDRDGTVAITSENTVDDLETFTKDDEEYVRVYAIWHKDE